MQTTFEPRMGVVWDSDDDRRIYGVVTKCSDGCVDVVRVLPLKNGVHCYDEGINLVWGIQDEK